METNEPTLPYQSAGLPVEQRVADLLERLTLEEKIDQLHQCGMGDANPNNLTARGDELRPTYGSFIVGGGADLLATRNALQRRAVTETRLGIPALFAADVIHGYRTIMPIPLAQACSWNAGLMQQACAIAALEARAHGIDWTFAPMVDHCVDPRWGRIAETFGESPHAACVFAVASVRGYQGPQPGAPGSVAACLKHYVGYGASEGGRDYSFSAVAPQSLWEMHLPPFAAGVRAGACTVMSAFNDLNGVPTSANHYTLTEVLREQWGFDGLVVSDWNAVLQLTHQGFAGSEAEAAEKAINAGVDVNMADGLYREHLASLIEARRVDRATIDAAVRRVLRLKFELGLFEHPYADRTPLTGAAPPGSHLALAEEFAAQSMVLLKNDDVLPLAAGVKRIVLVGPLAQDAGAHLGSWAQQGQPAETPSLADELRRRLPSDVSLRIEPGCTMEGPETTGIAAAVTAARESDLVVLCLGEHQGMSGENASRSTLRLAGQQEPLARAIAATDRPIVLVLVAGRPLELESIVDSMSAIVAAWQGGNRAAAALADILLGRRNPSGRLALTWPRTTGQIPTYHNMRPRARLGDEGAYRDATTGPLFAFGHGLSYTSFAYSPIRLSRETVRTNESLVADVTVTNAGTREGRETIFWFIRDPAASITRPLRDLKHFEQAVLAPGDSRVVRFEIQPARDLTFPDADGRPIVEAGTIELHVGGHVARFAVVE